MKIKAQLIKDKVDSTEEVLGREGEVVNIFGFVDDEGATYAIVAKENQTFWHCLIEDLLYIA